MPVTGMLLPEVTHFLKVILQTGWKPPAEWSAYLWWRMVQKTKRGKQAIANMSVVWLIVELAERRATNVAYQRCAEAILFRLDKPSLLLNIVK